MVSIGLHSSCVRSSMLHGSETWPVRKENDLHMVQLMPLPPITSCFIEIQNGSAFLLLTYPGCPEKRPFNGCCCSFVVFV